MRFKNAEEMKVTKKEILNFFTTQYKYMLEKILTTM
jgi:hypothetical protein